MNNKEILDNAPEGFTHAKTLYGQVYYYAANDNEHLIFCDGEWHHRLAPIAANELRAKEDIERIVELESENEKLKMLLEIANAGIEFSTAQTKLVGELGSVWKEKNQIKCLWDALSYEDKNKPMGLSCNCPKCSVTC